jgi:hypothetical protein
VGATALAAWACNVQPPGEGKPLAAPPEARLAPEPGTPGARANRERVNDRRGDREGVRRLRVDKRPRPYRPTGPQASKPAPLPKADKVVAIFHSGNVEGELDPCG